jgi:PII-like signaling protein
MKGFQITFFAEQEHRHDHTPMGDWLLQFAKDNGALGGSLMGAATGFGSAGKKCIPLTFSNWPSSLWR